MIEQRGVLVNFSMEMMSWQIVVFFRALVTKQNANLNTLHLHMEINKGIGM